MSLSELFLISTAFITFFYFSFNLSYSYLKPMLSLHVLMTLLLLVYTHQTSQILDPIHLLKILLLLASFILLNHSQTHSKEYFFIVLFTLIATLLLLSSSNILFFYLNLEFISLGSYLLAAYAKEKKESTEAGLKYFIVGAIASGLILFGLSLLYGFTASTDFQTIFQLIPTNQATLIGSMLLLMGLLFKLAAAPFHIWLPDIYEGSPMASTAFFALIPKLVILYLFISIAIHIPLSLPYSFLLLSSTLLSLFVGTLGALYQTRIKRLLAYSSITHIGFILTGIITHQPSLSILYLIIYIFTNLALFSFLLSIPFYNPQLKDFNGLASFYPLPALGITLALFSLAGIPPLTGFLTKFLLFQASWVAHSYFLLAFMILMSVLAAPYYLRIIQHMYFHTASPFTLVFHPSSSYMFAISLLIISFGPLLISYQ